ncbi:MAG: pyridoxal-phosphate dependent enzyme, partial [Planctomycetales bacterium]
MTNEFIYSEVIEMNGAQAMSAQLQERVVDLRETPNQRERHVYDNIVDLSPSPDNPTPMVRLSDRSNSHADYDVLLKLEGMNPFGSIKDRTAMYMLKGLQLQADQALVEPSAGNTGIALAALAN